MIGQVYLLDGKLVIVYEVYYPSRLLAIYDYSEDYDPRLESLGPLTFRWIDLDLFQEFAQEVKDTRLSRVLFKKKVRTK